MVPISAAGWFTLQEEKPIDDTAALWSNGNEWPWGFSSATGRWADEVLADEEGELGSKPKCLCERVSRLLGISTTAITSNNLRYLVSKLL